MKLKKALNIQSFSWLLSMSCVSPLLGIKCLPSVILPLLQSLRESVFIYDVLQASPELGGVDIINSLSWMKKHYQNDFLKTYG